MHTVGMHEPIEIRKGTIFLELKLNTFMSHYVDARKQAPPSARTASTLNLRDISPVPPRQPHY